jgi:hypothetical protein
MEQGEVGRLDAPAENQGRLVDPDKAPGGETHPGFGHVQSGHDSKLHGCLVVSLKVEDVAPHGMTVDRTTIRQSKTGNPVRFELSEQTREAVDDYIRSAPRRAGEFLFPNRCHADRCLTTRQYSRLVSTSTAGIDLDPALYGTH